MDIGISNLFFCALSQPHLLQQQFPVLVEQENTEGSMENPPGRARHKPMRQVFVHMAHNLIVLVQRDHLRVVRWDIEENTLGYVNAKRKLGLVPHKRQTQRSEVSSNLSPPCLVRVMS